MHRLLLVYAGICLFCGAASSQPASGIGVLHVSLQMSGDSVYAVLDDQPDEARLIGSETYFALSAGSHRLTIVPRRGKAWSDRVDVRAGDTTRYGLNLPSTRPSWDVSADYLRILVGADVVLAAEPEQRVYSNGLLIGSGSLLVRVPKEGAQVRVEDERGASRTLDLSPSPRDVRVVHAHLYPDGSLVRMGRFVPGLYQHALGRRWGVVLGAAAVGSAIWSGHSVVRASLDQRDFEDARRDYLNTDAPQLFERRFQAAERARVRARSSSDTRTAALSMLGGLVTVHALDVLLRPYRGPYRSRIDVSPLFDPRSDAFGLTTLIRLD